MKQIVEDIFPFLEELADMPACCPELRAAIFEWMQHVGSDDLQEQTNILIEVLEDSITPIDDVIAFFASEDAKSAFGEARANLIEDHVIKVKESGGTTCDCAACTLAQQILKSKEELLDCMD